LIDDAIHSVRRIATELRPAIIDDLGLVAAIEWAGEEFQARTGIKCAIDLPPNDVLLDPEKAIVIFRVFQEALTNVIRHAFATEVSVRLATRDDDLLLEVSDNGVGFSPEKLDGALSLGILGMKERAALVGADLQITSRPGNGTVLRVHVPRAGSVQDQHR
jgi:signal transduction histidine kinase